MKKRICLTLLFLYMFQVCCNAFSYTELTREDFAQITSQIKENKFTANFVQEVWPAELEHISVEITSEVYDKQRDVMYVLSLYNAHNQLVSVSTIYVALQKNTVKNTVLSASGAKIATKAKLGILESGTLKPLRTEKELHKIQNALTLFLDPTAGNDANDGSFISPLKTLEAARRLVRRKKYELTKEQNAIYVILKNGEYFMEKELTLSANDGGSDEFTLIFTALERQKAIITGAKDIDGFELYDSENNIYRAKTDIGLQSRHFYVNGVRCPRAARYTPLEGYQFADDTMTCNEREFLNFKHIEDVEFHFEVNWMHDRCQVSSITELDDGSIRFNMNTEVWRYMMSKTHYDWAEPTYLENAYEFLDEEGEWYLDSREGYLYYKPRFFENIENARCVIPVAEDLITATSLTDPLKNLTFRGIHFTGTTWLFPITNGGMCIIQNESYRNPNGSQTFMDAAVDMKNTENVSFYNCKFSGMGKTALKFSNGVKNANIIGNEFTDMSAGALSVGGVTDAERNPANTNLAVKNVRVENNFINGAAIDIKSTAALSAGFPIDTHIANNEIFDTGYSGIHTGWGWDSTAPAATENFSVSNNYIHRILNSLIYDGGAVYMLGHTNGSAEKLNQLTGNYVQNIMKPFGALYPDQGSSYWQISDNVVDLSEQLYWTYGAKNQSRMESRWTHIHMNTISHIYFGKNYSTTYNYLNRGTAINYRAPQKCDNTNWPAEAKTIIAKSGIQPAYTDNFIHALEEFGGNSTTVKRNNKLLLDVVPLTSKAKYYNTDKFICYATIADDGILEIQDGDIYAIREGETTVELTAVENGRLIKHSVLITVTK